MEQVKYVEEIEKITVKEVDNILDYILNKKGFSPEVSFGVLSSSLLTLIEVILENVDIKESPQFIATVMSSKEKLREALEEKKVTIIEERKKSLQ